MGTINRNLKDEIKNLLTEVIDAHCDIHSPDYNNCESPVNECEWCRRSKRALLELDKTLGNIFYSDKDATSK